MNAGLLDMLHHARDEDILAVAEAINVHLDRVGQIAVEQQRIFAQHRIDLAGLVIGIARLDLGRDKSGQRVEQIIIERAVVADDRHRTSAQHIGRAHHQRQAQFLRHDPRLFDRIGDPVLRLFEAELVEQALELVAVFGEIDRIDRGAENGNAGVLQRLGQFERGLAAELHDHALERPRLLLLGQDLQHVLAGQRLEIKPVRCVVVGGNRLRIAVDHDGFIAGVAERETGVAAAIVEFDALPDAVWPAPENDDFSARRGARLAGGTPAKGAS